MRLLELRNTAWLQTGATDPLSICSNMKCSYVLCSCDCSRGRLQSRHSVFLSERHKEDKPRDSHCFSRHVLWHTQKARDIQLHKRPDTNLPNKAVQSRVRLGSVLYSDSQKEDHKQQQSHRSL